MTLKSIFLQPWTWWNIRSFFNFGWSYTVALDAFEEWIEKTVRRTWGLKAAVHAYHIALRGVDVEIETMLRGVHVASIPKRDKSKVPGALTNSLNLFAISQALTWLAGERRELQEQLSWKSQVYPMLARLVPNGKQGALGFPPGMLDSDGE